MDININYTIVIIYLGFPVVIALGTALIRSLLQRLTSLENEMQTKTTDQQVRQLLSDKYAPMADDIQEIKEMQHKLFDLYVEALTNKKPD